MSRTWHSKSSLPQTHLRFRCIVCGKPIRRGPGRIVCSKTCLRRRNQGRTPFVDRAAQARDDQAAAAIETKLLSRMRESEKGGDAHA